MVDSRQEIIDLRLRTTATELGEFAARHARHEGPRTPGAELACEQMIQCGAIALAEAVEARGATAIVTAIYYVLAGCTKESLQLADADRARADRAAAYRAEEQAKERADREAQRTADELEARRLGREWRRRGGPGLDLEWVARRVTSTYPRLAEHEASVRAGWLDEDEHAANPPRT